MCVCVCVCVCVYVCVCVCVCVYVCVCAHAHTLAYTCIRAYVKCMCMHARPPCHLSNQEIVREKWGGAIAPCSAAFAMQDRKYTMVDLVQNILKVAIVTSLICFAGIIHHFIILHIFQQFYTYLIFNCQAPFLLHNANK